MGAKISRPCHETTNNHQPHTETTNHIDLATVLYAAPQIIDELDIVDLKNLCRVNSEVRAIADHPTTWKNLFSKKVGIPPQFLPDPNPTALNIFNTAMVPPFKILCRGLFVCLSIAENPLTKQKISNLDRYSLEMAQIYIRENLEYIRQQLLTHEHLIEQYKNGQSILKKELLTGVGLTVLSTAGSVGFGYYFNHMLQAIKEFDESDNQSTLQALQLLLCANIGIAGMEFCAAGALAGAAFASFTYCDMHQRHLLFQQNLRNTRIELINQENRYT